ncbi:MAG TPA: diguanylate cyclase, partial [Dehalococcoidia bacterium]|nr:diguanylate cyclase [Dehalococcoidia bacterium]
MVDDEPLIGETLRDILAEKGFDPYWAKKGQEALDLLRERFFPVLLVDIKLPDLEGVELLKRAKLLWPEAEGIIITGYATLESAMLALRQGAFDYITKPLALDEVISSVSRAAAKQRARRQLDQERARLRDLATRDTLTELYNRRYFQVVMDWEVEKVQVSSRPLSLIMVDVDNFKAFQDSHGHPAGDKVLRGVASILRGGCRQGDVVARYGGEEFAILLPEAGRAAAVAVAE